MKFESNSPRLPGMMPNRAASRPSPLAMNARGKSALRREIVTALVASNLLSAFSARESLAATDNPVAEPVVLPLVGVSGQE